MTQSFPEPKPNQHLATLNESDFGITVTSFGGAVVTKMQRQNPEASPRLLTVVPDAPMPNVNPEGFYQIPNSMAVKAIRAKLTAADWTLWSYLQMPDPHGDRMIDLPSPAEMSACVGLSEKQIRRSMIRLVELEFYKSPKKHQKRVHLFGKAKGRLATAETVFNELDIIVTFEFVKGGDE